MYRGMIGTGGSIFSFAHHLKLAKLFLLRLRKRKAKRREEYLLNRGYELEFSRVRYDADAEQRRASACDMYRANLESNRAFKRWQQEKNSVAVRASKMRRYELNSDEKRASKRESLAREF